MAACYDDFNHRYMHERWTGRLLEKAEEAGLDGKRLLDVGCGTGLSFLAMLDRGFEVTACDISPAMVEQARVKVGARARLLVADMGDLPALGEFDLAWAVNDAINYLMSAAELVSALAGMRRNLAPGGIALFDVNTLDTYRTWFAEEHVELHGGRRLIWRGMTSAKEVEPGSVCEARLEGDGVEAHFHRQRHFPEAEVMAAIESAGLRPVASYGELDGELDAEVDELHHSKAVYVAAPP